ncbi:MAG: aldehyde dehydrogenase family protein [Phycisphaerae bacterium]
MLRNSYPLLLANQPQQPNAALAVTNKYLGVTAAHVAQADETLMDRAIGLAHDAARAMREIPAHARRDVLAHVAARLGQRSDEFAHVLAVEAGKPIRDARGEIARAQDTFRVASEEATRISGQWLPLDISPRSERCEGILRRFAVGACGFITPFNFPLNLAAHKIAPAIAAGCPWVLKPASYTPISAILLGEILAETDLPRGAFSILPCPARVGQRLATDDRIRLLSFTGSPETGWALREKAPRKRVTLELGGNAACIVDERVDLDHVAERITFGAFYQSGQSCISVQRVLIHRSAYDALKHKLIERAVSLKSGDPLKDDTFLGPLISESDAIRLEAWVSEACAAGARVLCGGRRNGAFFDATLLENVAATQKISCVEAFGPVATLTPFDDFAQAVTIAGESAYGLQCGVFTRDLNHVMLAFNELEVGGVIINDVPSFRVDSMPYGGVKMSGVGREGVRFAIEEMTEPRLMVIRGEMRR